MSDCVFCGIADGDIPADVVGEGATWVAFRDLDPRAPVHALVIPREHVTSLADLGDERLGLGGTLLAACREVARTEGLEDGGYRVVTNVGDEGGQDIPHLHFHVLGGRRMGWPPG